MTPLLGGLWALKKGSVIPYMGDLVNPHLESLWAHGKDQVFLANVVYPLLKDRLLVHTSQQFRYSNEEIHRGFPWNFTEACYCGRVEGVPQPPSLLRIFRR